MNTYTVNRTQDWGAVMWSLVSGQKVEVFRKDAPPPIGTVEAKDISDAITIARRRYGHDVVVSKVGVVENMTR